MLLYLIVKAKSHVSAVVLWRPIAAASAPLVNKSKLHVAAWAFTMFVQTLVWEIPAGFLTLNPEDMGPWIQQLGTLGGTCIREADCKKQFNVIPPSAVAAHMYWEASWLKLRRQWRATTLVLSVCKTNEKYNHPGEGKQSVSAYAPPLRRWVYPCVCVPLMCFRILSDLTYPNALGCRWELKMGVPLQSFWAVSQRQVSNTFIGALHFVSMWGGILLNNVAWMQVADLSHYPKSLVQSSMIYADLRCNTRLSQDGSVDIPLATSTTGVSHSKGVHSNPPKMDTSAITTSAHIART